MTCMSSFLATWTNRFREVSTEEWRCSKCPRGQLAMFMSNSKLGVWIGMAEWSLVNVSISIKESAPNPCLSLTEKIIPDQRVSSKLFWIHYCEILGVLETWFFSTKHGGLFSIITISITRELCQQGFVHQGPSPSKFAQDFNSYTAYFANASEEMWLMIVD